MRIKKFILIVSLTLICKESIAKMVPLGEHTLPATKKNTINTKIVPVSVSRDVKYISAPDKFENYYATLDGTHYSYRCLVSYKHPTNQADVETCEIPPVKLKINNWPETEVINLISGTVNITEKDGSKHTYSKGDIFILPKGFNGIWDQPGTIIKVIVRNPLFWKD